MSIKYKIDEPVSVDQFVELLRESTLAERRPIDDLACMEGVVKKQQPDGHGMEW